MNKVKLLVVIEATKVSGPAKNLLGFLRQLRSSELQDAALPQLDCSIVTFQRYNGTKSSRDSIPNNEFVAAARAQDAEIDVIAEQFAFDPGVISQLRHVVRRRAPTLVQTHMVKSHFLVNACGISREYPWIAYHHGYTTTDLKMRAYNQLNRWSLPSALHVITVCEAFASQLSQAGVDRRRISVCHNSVVPPVCGSSDEIAAFRKQLGIREEEKVVLSVGRLSREKGHIDLVRALAILRKMSPSLHPRLILVGEGPERERIEALAIVNGINEQLVFAGHTNEVHKYYGIANLLALASHSEGSPNVLLEAMSIGLPVVATAVGGVPEIATTEENALLVPPDDPNSLAEALRRLLDNHTLAQELGLAAAIHVRDKFSPAAQARSLLQIYQRVLAQSSKAMAAHV